MRDKKPVTELKDTVELMNSADYKERFKAEFAQVVIRYQKLKAMLEKWDNGELNLYGETVPVFQSCFFIVSK